MTKREIVSRYKGSMLGLLWTFINPLLMLAVYTFVFSVVFQAKWGGAVDTEQSHFSVILFAGLIIHGFFSEVLLLSTNSITGNSNYVKKVVFPLHILSLITTFAALFNFVIGSIVLISISLLLGSPIHWTIIFTPLVILPLFVLAIGVGWFISALGVYIRDIGQFMGVLTSVLLFMSPIFFSINMLPEYFQKLMMLNPLTFIIEQFRAVFLWGQMPDFLGLVNYLIIAMIFTASSLVLFNKLKKGFADVL
ncbi:ABC transporter permease [Vibrio barjaei]|uniref:ABC transporter permease n=1 Tax=Vibrio barjaei TaxID=1676683 RepID=UPI0022845ADB|nr:ABC transporter permease [Vibrio barjaei]MCY9872545.1 ABC transporter permease [Vibrio barjaei]